MQSTKVKQKTDKNGKVIERKVRKLQVSSSSETESDEDLGFLANKLKKGELDEIEERLLKGII